MAGLITHGVLRGVTHFATDIDMETDPKCLDGIELMRFEAWSASLHRPMKSYGRVIDPSPGLSGITVATQGSGESSNL